MNNKSEEDSDHEFYECSSFWREAPHSKLHRMSFNFANILHFQEGFLILEISYTMPVVESKMMVSWGS